MRRFHALLIAAGLAAAPASAAAGPSQDLPRPPDSSYEQFDWSIGKGRLGVMVMSLTPELRTHFGAAADRGVLVAQVQPGTPAAAAGIAVGDVIVEVGSSAVDSPRDVVDALSTIQTGKSVDVKVVRDGKPRTLATKITDAPDRLDGAAWIRQFMRSFDLMRPAKPERSALRS